MNKLISYLLISSNSLCIYCQNYFNTVLPSVQNNVDGIYHPLIELNPDTLIAFTNTVFSNRYGGACSYNTINNNGNLITSDIFLDTINEIIISDAKMLDQNVYISGSKSIHKDTSEISWFAKLNLSLDTLWTREFRTSFNSPAFYNINKLRNSNLVLCGNDALVRKSGSLIACKGIFYLSDSLGNKISYIEILDSTHFPILYNSVEDDSGNIYVCGIVKKNDLNHDALIIKVSPEGKLLWKKQIPSLDYLEGVFNIFVQTDGSLLLVGDSYNSDFFGDQFSVILLINMNSKGTINWTKRILKIYDGEIRYCVEDSSNNYICSGTIFSEAGKKGDGYLVKFSAQGDSMWSRTINNSDRSTEQFFNIAKASDGGFYLTGFSWIEGINTSKSWIVKVDSFGCLVPGCQNTVKTKDVDDGKIKAFELYPNPANEVLYFLSRVTKNDDYTIHISDMQGKEVYCYQFMPVLGKQYIMEFTKNILPGIYVLRILDEKGKITQTERIEKL